MDTPDVVSSDTTKYNSNSRSQWKQWLASISATLSMVAVGTVYGWTTTILARLERGDADVPVKISLYDCEGLVSSTVITTMLGSFLGACLADIFGRKICLLCSSFFFIIGWLNVIFAGNVIALYAARIISGIGVGMSYTTNPMYVSEIADTNIRGALGTLIAINVNAGSLLTCSIGPYVSYINLGIILSIVPIIFVITFIWFPESPYYLVMKNRNDAAAQSLVFFKNIDMNSARREVDIILSNINETRGQSENWRVKIRQLLSYNNRKAFIIVFLLIVTQQLSGNFTILQYLTDLFTNAQIGMDVNVATIIVFAVSLVSGTLATATVERAGRRRLLIISTFTCAITLFILAIYLYLHNVEIDVSAINILPVAIVILFQITYQIGLGTLPNALIGELFPTNVKGIAAAGITISDGILGFIITRFYLEIDKSLGKHSLYFFFAGSCLVAFVFVVFCIPETQNKSFSEIQEELSLSGFKHHKRLSSHRKVIA